MNDPVEMAKCVFKDILNYASEYNCILPSNVLILGGVALSYYGLKDSTNDIDIYSEDTSEMYAISNRLMEKWRFEYGEDFDVDFTDNKMLWTDRITVGNLNQYEHLCFVESSDLKSSTAISILNPETIFILKSIADREKDREDIRVIFNYTNKQNIINCLGKITPFNKSYDNQFMIENTLLNLQELALELILPEDIVGINGIDEECLLNIASTFGIEDCVLEHLNAKFSKGKPMTWN